MNWIDFVGYTASFFVVLSFLIKQNVSRIRLVNLVGCVLFVIYGIYINSIPIIVPNAFLIFVQLYYLLLHPKKDNSATNRENDI
ncbi:SemiSWEET family transporter [Capnocytophaga canimorsus]|uniref:SemiSWEET family transporter n=1 Tax=Capnocytophaga canimorsus TaxID=28188 RepID=UPI000D6EAC9C|nr:SemiSWEET family transporter [Capnocytophaga canimorsus]AWL78455.1 uroporphyrinogen decarboxylase [Capnocytophaga canimorsus]AYW37073.1 uroporphyrinogen decarboxylase [Capnocytophaga canimorsus]MDT9499803.1 uroporphyrinogen decarboxylase [Capnocytophaga canimorsus]